MSGPWRSRLRIAQIALLLALCLPLHMACRALGMRSSWPRRFLRWSGRAAGIDVTVTGAPLAHNVMLLANHVSWLDILILAGASGARFVAKDEVARWPLFGYLAGLNRTIYVSRVRRSEVRAQADQLRAALAEGAPVALFPEGGTGNGVVVKPFHAALLAAVVPPLPGVLIQPVAIDYGVNAPDLAWVGDIDMGRELNRVLGLPGRRATLRFLPPMDPVDWPDRKTLADEARRRIVAVLAR